MQIRTVLILISIALLAIAGSGAMYMLVYALPVGEGNVAIYVLFTMVMIALGLTVPYWILKLGLHSAHRENPDEQEMTLRNFSKDKQDLERELTHHPAP